MCCDLTQRPAAPGGLVLRSRSRDFHALGEIKSALARAQEHTRLTDAKRGRR